jgi:hypothetical protein
MGACPIGADQPLSPEARDEARDVALQKVRGESVARAKPAAGFELGVTTRGDIEAWAQAAGVRCQADRTKVESVCTDVPAQALGSDLPADLATFSFDGHDRLVALDLTRRELGPSRAAELVDTRARKLTETAGAATKRRGTPSADYLTSGKLRQVVAEFAFTDYRAVVSATHMGEGRVVVREQFQLL